MLRPHRQEEEVPGNGASPGARATAPTRTSSSCTTKSPTAKLGKLDDDRKLELEGQGDLAEEFVDPGDRRDPHRERRGDRRRGLRASSSGSASRRSSCTKSDRETARGESPLIKNTIKKDPTENEAEALNAIYSLLRPGEAPNIETAREALERVFFNPKRYDLGRVGRYKINQRLQLDVPRSETVLTKQDFVSIVGHLIELNEGRGFTDDIDHLGNRRVRTVGELIANQFSVGLSRMARLVKERMSINTDPEKINIDDLVNARTVSAVIQAFFGSSQLSQFMDQTNPLAEMTHKRRLSALGPGGLTRERAGFEVRDVHYSHYGRMCPIETPEGPNIGLITSFTTYSRINDLGFVETPYRKVKNGQGHQRDRVAERERGGGGTNRAGERAPRREGQRSRTSSCCAVSAGDFPLLRPGDIDYMDVAPDQLVSVAAALIPFLEHDDANRALMGSNMQRQAVPLLYTDAPLVGTGLEAKVASDSGAVITARRGGTVVHVTADEIVIDTGSSATERRSAPRQARPVRPIPPAQVLADEPGHGHQPASPGQDR